MPGEHSILLHSLKQDTKGGGLMYQVSIAVSAVLLHSLKQDTRGGGLMYQVSIAYCYTASSKMPKKCSCPHPSVIGQGTFY